MAAVAGTEVQAPMLRFTKGGIIFALYAQEELATAVSYATTEIKVAIGGSDNLFNDGSAPAFVPLLALVGGAQNWYPLWRRVIPGVDWQITYRTSNAVAKTPSCFFSFISDEAIRKFSGT
jgi:hypothetical protein